jgi:anti-anti-sigma factor
MNTSASSDGAAEFAVAVHPNGACTVLKLSGELDAFAAPQLSAGLAAGTDTGCPIVIDLSELTFIDSSGIRALANECADHRVALVCPRDHSISRVLEIVDMKRFVPIYERHDEALTCVGAETNSI